MLRIGSKLRSLGRSRPRARLTTLMMAVLLIAVALGSYRAGYRDGRGTVPRDLPHERALDFVRALKVRSDTEGYAIYSQAKLREQSRPGYLSRKHRVAAEPTEDGWKVTFTDEATGKASPGNSYFNPEDGAKEFRSLVER